MDTTVHINDNVGRIAYEAWVSEFADDIADADPWHELTETAQAAWGDVGEAVIENRVRLPHNGVELTIRRPEGVLGFVWGGRADETMGGTVRAAVELALGAEETATTDRNGRLLETIWELNDRFVKGEDDDALTHQFLAIEQFKREAIQADRVKTKAALQRLLSIIDHEPDINLQWLYGELEALAENRA